MLLGALIGLGCFVLGVGAMLALVLWADKGVGPKF